MFLSARDSPRPSQPLDSCLLISRTLLERKSILLIFSISKKSFGTEYSPVSRKVTASQFGKHRIALHRDIIVAPCTRSFFRHDARHPDTPSHAAAAFLSNIDLSMGGKTCSLSLSIPPLSAGTYRRRVSRKEMRFRHGSERTSNAKNSRGSKHHSRFSKLRFFPNYFPAFHSDVRHDGDIIVFTLY